MRPILLPILPLAVAGLALYSGASLAAVGGCDTAHAAANGFDPGRLYAVLSDFQTGAANLHGLVIERHGASVAECYRTGKDRPVNAWFGRTVEFDAITRHDLRSASKSVTSLLWGIALAEHKVLPPDTRVLDVLPDLADLKTAGREDITVGNLLDMTSGLAWDESGPYGVHNPEFGLYWRGSQARYVFKRPMASPPGQRFNYNGGGTAVLAGLLEKGVGMPLPEYARERLFAPLGIVDWEWLTDYRGRPLAFAGLRMRPHDLARIGQLMLQRGRWEGRQIVPAAWIEASLRPHVDAGDGRQYGYQWWHGKTRALGSERTWTAAFGNGGQRLYVMPALGLVVVLTAGVYDDEAGAARVNRLFDQVAAALAR